MIINFIWSYSLKISAGTNNKELHFPTTSGAGIQKLKRIFFFVKCCEIWKPVKIF